MSLSAYPALVLNADYRPLSLYPLSLMGVEDSIRAAFKGTVNVLATYDRVMRSPSTEMKIPSVVALKVYQRPPERPSFTRFNVFLRDRFRCQYCGEKFRGNDLTFDHVIPRCRGGKTEWTNITSACSSCNTDKDDQIIVPRQAPFEPTLGDLMKAAREFPPNHCHETWLDFLYWDTELQA